MTSVTQRTNVEIYSEQANALGEGPIWSIAEQALYWLDIANCRLYWKRAGDSAAGSCALPDYPGCLAELTSTSVAVAMGEGLQRVDVPSGDVDMLRAAPTLRTGTRFNDGKVDPLGRLWVGTMQNNFGPRGESVAIERFDGTLYRFDADGSVQIIEENIGVPNTLAWSPDLKQFYFADSMRGHIYVYDFDPVSGDVRNKRILFESREHGIPDGSAIDVDGCLWNARWDGSAILRITPEGKIDRSIRMPIPRPTSCIFGGPNLDTLYVTSATQGLSPAQLQSSPLSGSVFAIHGLTQGMPVPALTQLSSNETHGSTRELT